MPIVVLSGPEGPDAPRLAGTPIESVCAGSRLRTRDGAVRAVRAHQVALWRGPALARAPHLNPVLIRRNAFGPDRPSRALVVSPNARFRGLAAFSCLDSAAPGGLVAAKHLTGLPGVHWLAPLGCRFVHPVLDAPADVALEGLWLHLAPPEAMSDVWSHALRTELRELYGAAPERAIAAG